MALQAPATKQTILNVKNIRSRSKWKTSLNSPPQLQFLILDGWQYAALANWVKGVKLDISAADNRLTALVSRSLSVTSGIPGSGIASTEAKSNVAVRERMEVVEKKDGSILSGGNEGRTGRGCYPRDERTNATVGGKGRPCLYPSLT